MSAQVKTGTMSDLFTAIFSAPSAGGAKYILDENMGTTWAEYEGPIWRDRGREWSHVPQ